MNSIEDFNKLGYLLSIHTHTLEKGLSHFELRPFGHKNIKLIIQTLNSELKYENHTSHYSFINGINSLKEFKKAYEIIIGKINLNIKKYQNFYKIMKVSKNKKRVLIY